MRKYKISYRDLVLNTLLDSIKRQNRYTIDTVDTMNYESIIKDFIVNYEIPMVIEECGSRNSFIARIDKYVVISNNEGLETYTLLPWITKEELEKDLENTIFNNEDMEKVLLCTTSKLCFSRNINSVDSLNLLGRNIYNNFLKSTTNEIRNLEQKKNNAEDRLIMIKKRMNIKD